MINLRPYQDDVREQCSAAFKSGHRMVCLTMPTGAGKTVTFSDIAQRAASRGYSIAAMVHRGELVRQISLAFDAVGVAHGIVQAGRRPRVSEPVQVATVQTLANRLSLYKPDLIIVDEAHHCTSPTYRKILDYYPDACVLGVTATPCRLDGTGLATAGYTKLIHGPDTAWLTAQGYLAPAEVYAPGGVDVSEIRTTAGDFNKKQLTAALDKPTITGDAVQHYTRLCPGVPAIAFCVSVKHAEHVAAEFAQAGYRAESIDGKMTAPERQRRLARLGTGEVQVLTSCDLISEGVDVPAVTAGIMLRPTQSLALWYQQIGRCLRTAPGKSHAVILDHVGNTKRHGLPWVNPPEWSLDSQRRGKRSEDDTGPGVRICVKCFRAFPSVPTCPHCGEVYPVSPREVATVAGELVKLDAAYAKAHAGMQTWQAGSLEDFQQIAEERGYKPGWARIQWEIRQKKRRAS